MSRRGGDGAVYVGRLHKTVRGRDLEDLFDRYGEILRCEVKYGMEMAFAFIDFKDRRDAEDAIKYEHGRDFFGNNIIVEWAKGTPRRYGMSSPYDRGDCYRCGRRGHFARDCLDGQQQRRPVYRSRYSPSPRRRRSRSRSRSKKRSRSRSRSHGDRRSRSPRRSRDRKSQEQRSHSRSKTPEKRSRSRSKNKSRSRSGSRSPMRDDMAQVKSSPLDRSPRSKSPTAGGDMSNERSPEQQTDTINGRSRTPSPT